MTTETKLTRYISRIRFLRIVMKSAYNKELDGKVVTTPGHVIEFQDGVYETSDPAEIEFLDARPELKSEIFIKVPDDVSTAAARAEHLETLEEREARIAAREKELGIEDKKVNANEEGGKVSAPGDGDEADRYEGMTGDELKDELRSRDLPVSGKVDELRERLRAHDAENGAGDDEQGGNDGPAY